MMRHPLALTGSLITLALLIISMYFMWLGRWPWQQALPWRYNHAGYQKAFFESRESGKPILLLLEKRHCRRCQLLEEQLLDQPELGALLSEFLLVRLDSSADPETRELVARYSRDTRLPQLFIETDPMKQAYPLHLNPELSHIWVPNQEGPSGNKMPLSVASFTMALERTLERVPPPDATAAAGNSRS